jgi:hypothetical protein
MRVRVSKSFNVALGGRARANGKSTSVVLGGKGCIALIVLALILALAGCSPAPSPVQKWQAGQGGKCLAKVEKDLNASDSSFPNEASAVFVAAANCAVYAPPAGGGVFKSVMEDISMAGMYGAALNVSKGEGLLSQARAELKSAPAGATWAPGLAKALGTS